MLNSMRTLSKGIVSKLLMLLLILSFAAWGIGDMLKANAPHYAAKVGGEAISLSEFEQQRTSVARQLEASGIKNLPKGQLEFSVIRQLIQQKLGLMAMRDMGLFVNDALVGKTIASIPEFQDEHGKFSSARFTFALEKQRLSEKAFVSQFKRYIAGNFLTDSLDMSDTVPPASIIALEAIIGGETRDAVLLTVPARDAMDEANETAFKAYYESHKNTDYLSTETRTLEYVVLTQPEIDALVDASITDAMVSEAMTTRKNTSKLEIREQLRKEERDSVMQTLSNTVEDELAAGKTIGQAFSKAGINATPQRLENATAAMAKSSESDITRTVAEQGFGLSEGEISRIIRSKNGTLLMVSAKKINAAAPKPYEQVRSDVKAHLGKELARDAARAKAQTVKEALAKAPNWQAVADEQNLASRIVSRVARPGADGKAVEGIPAALQQAIFERAVGEVAGPLALENGDQLMAIVTATHQPDIDTAAIKPSQEAAKIGKQLTQNIENRAYQAFGARHAVVINPELMRASASGE
jgi:peptidyl-prolyl cis-trans isomerase D